MAIHRSKEADEIIGEKIYCSDDGFIRLVDYMGTDSSIVQAARVSYGKGTKTLLEDRNLIRYLMRHRHTTPFEMVEMTFHARMPIFVARQWVRHRTANINEYSMRYSEPLDMYYLPEPENIAEQSKDNKQGRKQDPLNRKEAINIRDEMNYNMSNSFETYNKFNQQGLARELSRIILPTGAYTEWYWKNDLHNTLHFLNLRMDKHAQKEIRDYANAMATVVKKIAPLTYEAFEDYRLNAKTFSKQEMKALDYIVNDFHSQHEIIQEAKHAGLKGRELKEFLNKLK